MKLLIVVLIVSILLGGGGYPDRAGWGTPYYAGVGTLAVVLVILLILGLL